MEAYGISSGSSSCEAWLPYRGSNNVLNPVPLHSLAMLPTQGWLHSDAGSLKKFKL